MHQKGQRTFAHGVSEGGKYESRVAKVLVAALSDASISQYHSDWKKFKDWLPVSIDQALLLSY